VAGAHRGEGDAARHEGRPRLLAAAAEFPAPAVGGTRDANPTRLVATGAHCGERRGNLRTGLVAPECAGESGKDWKERMTDVAC
jgi:hypothetical protein